MRPLQPELGDLLDEVSHGVNQELDPFSFGHVRATGPEQLGRSAGVRRRVFA
jgi:hypothetical protein